MWLVIYVLFIYGLSNIVAFGKPFNFFRGYLFNKSNSNKFFKYFYEMITCMMCLPTWVGGFISILNLFIFKIQNLTPGYYLLIDSLINTPLISGVFIIIIDMCFTSGVVWLIDRIESYYSREC